jgi:hypothetical protein
MRMAEMSFERGTLMDSRRDEWIRGVQEMLDTLRDIPDLPYPRLLAESTFVAMVTEAYEPGELLKKLVEITNKLDGGTLEFYNWTEDKIPEMDRLRIVWMFGPIRYELDAGVIETFSQTGTSHRVFTNVNYIGENVNTIVRPDAPETS